MLYTSMGIHLKVANFALSKRFYEALGFKPVFSYGPNEAVKEDYCGVVYQIGETKLELADGHRGVRPEVFSEKIASSKVSLMINCQSLKDVLNRCKRASIPISVGVRHYYWGTLELVIKDPDGLVLVFIEPYSKKQAEQLKADETYSHQPKNF